MEVEHSAWLNEFFCSPECAEDRYFEYMESTPVDFENKLPDGASINADGFLVDDAEQSVHPTVLTHCPNDGNLTTRNSG